MGNLGDVPNVRGGHVCDLALSAGGLLLIRALGNTLKSALQAFSPRPCPVPWLAPTFLRPALAGTPLASLPLFFCDFVRPKWADSRKFTPPTKGSLLPTTRYVEGTVDVLEAMLTTTAF